MKKEKFVPERCEIIQKVQRVLGGKWKIEILYYIGFQGIHRFGELRRHIGGISESSLINQLRSLEEDGFISRYDYKELPPRVEYSLTDLGQSFMPVMEHVKDWGETHLLPLASSK
ncbi:MAG: helix-turn-helix transcriptional regulator [Clostridia bacterium]|nr:helix-turn-helix transcriptional regulator [Clostridia bacterium]